MTDAEFMRQLRLHGKAPACAFLVDYEPRRAFRWSVEEQMRARCLPTFHVKQLDPARADFRFLVGVPVHLHCDDMSRAVAWVDRLLTDGAGPIYQTTEGEVHVWPRS
jgi:hypothetical protein